MRGGTLSRRVRLTPWMLITAIVSTFLALELGWAQTGSVPRDFSSATNSAIVVSVAPKDAILQSGASMQFQDSANTDGAHVEWLAGGVIGGNSVSGTISTLGLYTAPQVVTPTSVTITVASSADPKKYSSAALTILPSPPPISITVSPKAISLQPGQTQQFIGSTSGSSDIRIIWLVNGIEGGNSVVGTISSSGAYVAPDTVTSRLSVAVTAKSFYSPDSQAEETVTILASARPAASRLAGTTYYVDSSAGSDTNNGKLPTKAWRTISKVNSSVFLPGDSVLFKKGSTWEEDLVVPSSGSKGNLITFGAYGLGPNPVFDGGRRITSFALSSGAIYETKSGQVNQVFEDGFKRLIKATSINEMVAGSWFWDGSTTLYLWASDGDDPNVHDTQASVMASGVNMNGRAYLLFDSIDVARWGNHGYNFQDSSGAHDITIQNANSTWHNGRGVGMGGYQRLNLSNITIDNLTAHDQNGEGVWVGNGTNLMVKNCTVFNSNADKPKGYEGIGLGNGILVGINSNGVVVQDNYVHDVWNGAALFVENEAGLGDRPLNVVLQRNHVIQSKPGESPAVSLQGDGTIFRNNLIEDSVSNSVRVENGGLNQQLYNNTIYAGGTWGLVYTGNGPGNNFENNIIGRSASNGSVYVGLGGLQGGVIDYNDYYPSSLWAWRDSTYPSSFTSWQAKCGCDTHSINADPKFVGNGSDYHLQPDSPCKNAGLDLGLGDNGQGKQHSAGSGYPIGAFGVK